MDRSIMRALFLGSIVAVLLLATHAAPVLAEDGAGPQAATIHWIDGWEAGRAEAKKAGRLIFLYFGRHTPH